MRILAFIGRNAKRYGFVITWALRVHLLAFVVLKLCGLLSWPWLLVLSPLFAEIGLTLFVLACLGFVVWATRDRE